MNKLKINFKKIDNVLYKVKIIHELLKKIIIVKKKLIKNDEF